ncbi:MAG: class I SAM-dependent methyltransferase [Bacteroidota bacterium]|nr:class I SAM-dependent methyltransferase [Bacteroidota bacterium]
MHEALTMIVYDSCPVCRSKNILPVLTVKDYTVSLEDFEIWECKHCTLRFTQSVPEAEDISRYYQSENYISHSDTSEGFINKMYHRVRKRTLLKKKNLVKKMTGKNKGNVLDIGSGTGAFLHTMQHAGWQATGLEPDEAARERALKLYGLRLNSSEQLYSLAPGSFDAITMWHVLEHVHDLHGYINQINNLLKPGGKIFIAVPNYTSYDEDVYRENWAAYDVPRHLYHFSPKAMMELLNLHGLSIDSIKPMWYDSFYVSLLSEKYKTGKANPTLAFLNGMVSNSKAMMNIKKCSSTIYVASHSNKAMQV